ncbi:hypothetical protein COCSADRAFT_27702 [Bipolaris sorokiniana ND90Pr]|uniref:Uncharacterized protein n=1 Tax=Cochliobolus sativus (strain ND90Pr / ATCC 201652) TaxID=665912 RepID=M2T236_COCSN|nr:uncharacterized protein COCSADRAFT_27702 [Bipolaris sorokiniana ND90Pr]EMD63266.1 hypothetical protein COCSADRAFT_27702 [Bipolaris sorokiniana ND90Pr]
MTSRRPSTANDAGSSRMPFTSAEALLWGPEMKKQHAYLLTEMRALQKQHEGYDARIRATEAAAAAAEATTVQIRHLEQQLAAIEAENNDKAFEKWASGEMTRLSVFVDTNKNITQKQIELENRVSSMPETFGKLSRRPMELDTVIRRLELLEHSCKEDADRIQSLEGEIGRLRSVRESKTTDNLCAIVGPTSKTYTEAELIDSQLSNCEIWDGTTGPNSEPMLLSQTTPREEIQVPQTPVIQTKSPGTAVIASPTEDGPVLSDELRLLQRPSVHDSKMSQSIEKEDSEPAPAENPRSNMGHASPPPTQLVSRERQRKKPMPTPASQQKAAPLPRDKAPANVAPATQLVDRSPRKRKQPHTEPQSQRLTRSSAKKMEAREGEMQASIGSNTVPGVQSASKIEPTSLPQKKLKVTNSPKKKKISTPFPVATCPEVRKRLIVKLPSPRKQNRIDADLINHSPCEAAGELDHDHPSKYLRLSRVLGVNSLEMNQ